MDDISNWFGEIPTDVNYDEHILQVLGQIVKNYFSQREVINREIVVIKAQVMGYKNELPANYDARQEIQAGVKDLKVLTARIDKGREMPTELLKTAALPIPGLSVDGEGKIRIGKTLIDGLSEGEQLELAFRVAKAQAGQLKLIWMAGTRLTRRSGKETSL